MITMAKRKRARRRKRPARPKSAKELERDRIAAMGARELARYVQRAAAELRAAWTPKQQRAHATDRGRYTIPEVRFVGQMESSPRGGPRNTG